MPYVPCRACLTVNTLRASRCHLCGCEHPGTSGHSSRRAPRPRRAGRAVFLLSLAPLLACGAGGDPAARQRYEADKQKCESLSPDQGARKSCMVYRGWPDGKFR